MNFKKLFLMLTLLVLTGTMAFAQTTFYVNSVSGLDGYNGLSATVQGGGVGPKLTIQNAVNAASDGDIISVAGNTLNPYSGAVVVNKTLTFVVTEGSPAGTPLLNGNFTVNDATGGDATDGVTFTGNYYFGAGVTFRIQSGNVRGSGFVNFVGTSASNNVVRRTDDDTYFDAAPVMGNANSVDLTYDDADITVGPEWTSSTAINDVAANQTGGNTLTLDANHTLNGALSVAGGGILDIGSYDLTLNNPSTSGGAIGHVITGDIVSSGVGAGYLIFAGASSAGTVTLDGDGDIPNIKKSGAVAVAITPTGGITYNIDGNIEIDAVGGNLTFTPDAATTTLAIDGNVTNNGSGNLDFDATNDRALVTVAGNVTNGNSGNILFGGRAHDIDGNVVNSGSYSITGTTAVASRASVVFDGGANVNIDGAVTNSKQISLSGYKNSNVNLVGNISFGPGAHVIDGNVTNSAQLSGSRDGDNSAAANGGVTNSCNIFFTTSANTDDLTLGGLSNSTSNSFDASSGSSEDGSTFTNNGNIYVAATNSDVTVTGEISNTSSGWGLVNSTPTAPNTMMGSIYVSAPGSGALTTKGITNSSTSTSINGMIDFGAAGTGAISVTGNVTNSSTSTVDIIFGTGAATINGDVVNTGGVNGATIVFSQTANAVDINGTLKSNGSGVISFLSTGGAINPDYVEITSGTVNLGAAASAVSVGISGGLKATGGSLVLGSAAKSITVTGPSVEFGVGLSIGTTANPHVLTMSGTVAQVINVSSGGTFVFPGDFVVNNGIVPGANALTIQTGNLMFNDDVTFTNGQVVLGNNYLFIKGDFAYNNSADEAYSTGANGFISMQDGGAPNVVTIPHGSTTLFGNFEVDNANGATFGINEGAVALSLATDQDTYTFAGAFNMTNGAFTAVVPTFAGNIDLLVFKNTTTYPTIYVNNGTFGTIPTWASGSLVNVTYIGGSKTFANEVPPTATAKLNNLTVATTGANTVTANVNFTVFGGVTVNTGQTLALVAQVMTMGKTNGSSASTINLLGTADITATTGSITLGSATGTVVTGAGSTGSTASANTIPQILVNTNSVDNSISGIRSLVSTNPNITISSGGSLALSFVNQSGVTPAPANFTDLTMNASAVSLTLGSDVRIAGNATLTAGTLALGNYDLRIDGATNAMNTAASVTSTGGYIQLMSTGAATFTLSGTGAAATIPYLDINLNANTDVLQLLGTGYRLAVSNTLLHTQGILQLGTAINATHLRVTGNIYDVDDIVNATINTTGIGQLQFYPAAGTVVWTLSDPTEAGTAYTISDLYINGAVTLAGEAVGVDIATALTLNSGTFTFDDKDVTLTGAATFTRVAGTLDASTGYLIDNSTGTLTQGSNFSVKNFKISNATGAIADKAFVVTDNLYLNGVTFNHKPASTARLAIGIADTSLIPTVTIAGAGNLSDVPTFAQGQINLVYTGATTPVVVDNTMKYWPATPTSLVNSVTVNMSAPGDLVRFDKERTINGTSSLTLTRGILGINQTILNLASGITITRTTDASINLDPTSSGTNGTLNAPEVNIVYAKRIASDGAVGNAGPEYTKPTVVKNVTANNSVTLNDARTIAGNLEVNKCSLTGAGNSTLTVNANTTINGTVAVAASQILTVSASKTLTNKGNVTVNGTINGAGQFAFGGVNGQTLTLPSSGATMTTLSLNMTGATPALNVSGGSLTIDDAGTLTFVNGILNMGTSTLILPNPSATGVTNGGLSFDRSGVTGTQVGHVVGKVQRAAATGDGRAGTNGRFEFPVGTLTGEYRPAAITFTPEYVVGNPVNIIVSHVDTAAAGTKNLPLDGGNSVKIGNYPDFYWLVSTSPTSLTSTQKFDIDLQANNIGYPYDSDQNLRMIRRQDGSALSNGWVMQGTYDKYANYQVVDESNDTTVVVRTVSGQGGLIQQGSRFAIGLPTRAPSFSAPTVLTASVNEGETKTIQVTADANDVGETITYSLVGAPAWATINATTGLLTLKPGYDAGSATAYSVVVRASDGSSYTDLTLSITVVDANRAPSFTATGASVPTSPQTVKYGTALALTYVAVDADGTTPTYSYTVAPAFAGTAAIASGVLTITPAFADAGKEFTFSVAAVDASTFGDTVDTKVNVTYAFNKGDVNGSGTITSADATPILEYVVGLTTLTDAQKYYADVNGDGTVGAIDAAWILYAALHEGHFPTAKSIAASGNVEFGSFTSEKGVLSLPISLTKASGVLSVYTELNLGNNVEFKSVTNKLPEGWIVASNFENGVLKVAMAGTEPLNEGSYAVVNLALANKEAVVTVEGSAKLNDESSSTMVAKLREIPTEFALSQNYPNPFNPTTSIKYQLSQNANVKLVVYNMLGQVVKTLVNQEQEAGYYTIKWNGTNDFGGKVSSGIYIYRIIAGDFISTVKMNLLK